MPNMRTQAWDTAGAEGDTPEGGGGGGGGSRWKTIGEMQSDRELKKNQKMVEEYGYHKGMSDEKIMSAILARRAQYAKWKKVFNAGELAARVKQGDAIREAYRARKAARPKLIQAVGLLGVGTGLFRSNKGGAK